jgi:hypothetical protein
MNFHPPRPPRREQRLLNVFGTRREAPKCLPVVQARKPDAGIAGRKPPHPQRRITDPVA